MLIQLKAVMLGFDSAIELPDAASVEDEKRGSPGQASQAPDATGELGGERGIRLEGPRSDYIDFRAN
jgi:hypothetical protein